MALGKIEVTEDERDLRISPDRVIGNCRGKFGNGTEFRILDGVLTVKEVGAADFIDATPDEILQVRQALEDRFGERFKADRVQINNAGLFVLLDTAPPTEFERAAREGAKTIAGIAGRVSTATAEATKGTLEAVGITGKTVRKNGMVSMARSMLERSTDISIISEELTRRFYGQPDLDHLVQVAIREAQDDQKNKAEDFGTVSQFKLDAAIVTRLEAGEDADDIRNALRPTLGRVAGRATDRSDGEVESILTIAFERAAALETVRANKKARADRVKGAAKAVVNFANEKVGNTSHIVRENGMVSTARRLLEGGRTPAQITTTFETEFRGTANLAELTRVALKEAVDDKKNKAAAAALVKARSLPRVVAERLSTGESEDAIESSLSADYLEYVAPGGFRVERSNKEVEEILDLAMTQGIAIYEGRKKEAAGSLVVAARDNGMVSIVRRMIERGDDEDAIRARLRADYRGTARLSDLIDAAIREHNLADRNRQWASVMESRLGLGARVADRLHRGASRDLIRSELETELLHFRVSGNDIYRSYEEVSEIISAAFAEADKIANKREKVKEATLVSRANELGMVVEAANKLLLLHESPDEAESNLIRQFPVDGARELAAIAVRDAQDDQKVYLTLCRRLERNNEAATILNERTAGTPQSDIEARLTRKYGDYTAPGGNSFQLCRRDIREMLSAADDLANALERKRADEVEKARNKKHLKNTLKSWVPGTEQAGWDKRLVDLGIIREIRMSRENGTSEDTIRSGVERRLAGEKDPAGMANYAMARASDDNFTRKQAERVAFMESFDHAAARRLAVAGVLPAAVEAQLVTDIQAVHADMSNAEATEIAQAAIRRAQAKTNWERRGAEAEVWARGPGREGLKKAGKYAAMGAGLLGLGTAAVATVGTGLGLYYGWQALKWTAGKARGVASTTMAYALPLGGAAVKTTLDATVGVAKLARNSLLYAPASWVSTIATRAYQGARAGLNFPTPARKETPLIKEKKGLMYPFTALGNLFRRTTTGSGNLVRGVFHRFTQGLLAPVALAAGLLVGGGEGALKAGHHIFGYDWNGSHALDHLAEHTSHAPHAPAPHGHPAAAHAPAAAAHGGGHGDAHAPAHH